VILDVIQLGFCANMNESHDLAQLADKLAATLPGVRELYLFGSRRFQTQSPRSDVDVLVLCDGNIRPQQLREFIAENCEALDLFTVKGGRATSCQNESFIEANTQQQLIQNLNAVKFWTRNGGRLQANIDWTFTTRSDITYEATALPNRSFAFYDDPSKMKIGQLIRSMTVPQFWTCLASLGVLLLLSFGIGYWAGGLSGPQQNSKSDDSKLVDSATDNKSVHVRTGKV